MATQQETKTISGIIPYFGSIIVIISFFLPWVGSSIELTGPKLVGNSFRMFEMAKYNSEFYLIGIFLLLFLLSPIVCHIINAMQFYKHKYMYKDLAIIPLAIWIIEIIIAIIYTASKGEFSLPTGDSINFGLGAIGTLIGMIITIYLLHTNKVPDSDEVIKVTYNEIQFCPNCGFKLENAIKYCPECGTDLEKDN